MRASSLRRSTRLTAAAIRPGLGGGFCSSRVKISRTCGTVNAGFFFPQLPPLQGQEPQGQQRQRHVVMPTRPTPHLVMVQAHFPFAFLKHLLDPMPFRMRADHLGQRDFDARIRHRVVRPRSRLHAADHDHPLRRSDAPFRILGLHPARDRLHHQRAFRPGPDFQPLPPARRLPRRPVRDLPERRLEPATARPPRRRRRLVQIPDRRVARHVQHVTLPPVPQAGAEGRHATELVIGGHPAVGHFRTAAAQQVVGDAPLLLKLDGLGDVALGTPSAVHGPVRGQVQAAVQGRVAACGGVAQKDAGLAVLFLAEPAAPLALDATRLGAFFGERTAIDDQDAVGVCQLLTDVATDLGQDGGIVPEAGAEEVLDGLTWSSGLIGDRLGGLALQAAESPLDDDGSEFALLDALEERQVALQEAGEVVAAADDGRREQERVRKQRLRRRVFEDSGHKHSPTVPPVSLSRQQLRDEAKGLQ